MQKPSNSSLDHVAIELMADNVRLRTMVAELKTEICTLKAALRDHGYGPARLVHSRAKRLPPPRN
jgi:hypothetical protein